MLPAILNIAGGMGMLVFMLLMTLRGTWARQGRNRALAASVMLASVSTVMLASRLEQHGSRARMLTIIVCLGYAAAVAALGFWLLGKKARSR